MSLTVHTAQYAYPGGDRLDVTRSGAERALRDGKPAEGEPFAPPRWLLNIAKGYPGALRNIPRNIAPPSDPGDVAVVWDWYEEQYIAAMRKSYREHRAAWSELLSRTEVTLVCFCADPQKCHRTILARILERLGATYAGERQKIKQIKRS